LTNNIVKIGEVGAIIGGRNKHHTSPEFILSLLHTKAEELRPPQNTVFVAERTDKIVDVFKVGNFTIGEESRR